MKSSILEPKRAIFLVVASLLAAASCVSEDQPVATLSCETYCGLVQQKCATPNEQYRSTEECLSACRLLPLGFENDGDRNTIGCRKRIAETATTLEQCVKAGPYGGGTCGNRCTSFCTIVAKNCTGANAPYRTEQDCIEACATFTFDPMEGEGPNQEFAGKNTLNCRSHHLILALGDPAGHCPHAGEISVVCTK
jgi:hypothetical protein